LHDLPVVDDNGGKKEDGKILLLFIYIAFMMLICKKCTLLFLKLSCEL
jgi:hypothetical protein